MKQQGWREGVKDQKGLKKKKKKSKGHGLENYGEKARESEHLSRISTGLGCSGLS